ncbi:IQ calmodulin-binding motif-containing protein 1 [Synchiropus splendidus]|uniref:IQ calmodulin-binding motif-containing protein 1 n=1 Tax=Synchiropus splendidus TaxID=270530 RepID=UPI00237E59D9|nr:IQ calmodulin-binding motif-containing protein 1 [Synchiropus splendidus]XP_053699780.1 IQ calmodulin-binding motif-containing protein 1 [Synchiropus splendidus]XP_053699787.1 IQ calmodulin-binding motif-containing protein 1 [Synchiropus splendidus]XP_053699797.1 IQ calmodulin-binding motif-containing protein 1 [Synchiropus splendidus]
MDEEAKMKEVQELGVLLEAPGLGVKERLYLLISTLQKLADHGEITSRLLSNLHRSGVLPNCVTLLSLGPRHLQEHWSECATLALLISHCCSCEGSMSASFQGLLLPSLVDSLLSLTCQLMLRAESDYRMALESLSLLLRRHSHLTAHVLSSIHYERIQMCDDATVSLLCIQMWIHICKASRDFLAALSEDSILLLLNDAVGQLAVSSNSSVGGACIRLILLMSDQLDLKPFLHGFKGLESLLAKDWHGRGFDSDVNKLIHQLRPHSDPTDPTRKYQMSAECVRAACVIQAAWRSYLARRRVKSLSGAVTTLQRRFRARKRQQQQQKIAQQLEEELKFQMRVRRQQARRRFHQKQRELLQKLPAEQVQWFLQNCEQRAAVIIQRMWRGFRVRQHYQATLGRTRTRQQAARTLQRAVRRFLKRRRTARAQLATVFGQNGLTDTRRVELKKQVEEYISNHPSPGVHFQDCQRLHDDVQRRLQQLQVSDDQKRVELLLIQTNNYLDLLQEAPALSDITAADVPSFLSHSGTIAARARQAHNARMLVDRLPWWRTLRDSSGSAQMENPEMPIEGLYVGGQQQT